MQIFGTAAATRRWHGVHERCTTRSSKAADLKHPGIFRTEHHLKSAVSEPEFCIIQYYCTVQKRLVASVSRQRVSSGRRMLVVGEKRSGLARARCCCRGLAGLWNGWISCWLGKVRVAPRYANSERALTKNHGMISHDYFTVEAWRILFDA